jgi:hypothetical protein
MKSISHIIGGFLASVSLVLGGGNTSVVHLSEVHSMKIEPEKITIIGTGYVEMRIMTDRQFAASEVFGRPAEMVRSITTRGTFEIIPYFSNSEINGVPTGGHDRDELRKLSEQWWKETEKTSANFRPGDSVTIGYQEDRITISEFQVKTILGAGSLTIIPKGAPPATAPDPKSTDIQKPEPESEGHSR